MENELTQKTPFIKKFIGNKAFYKMVLAVALPIMLQNGITNFVNLLDNIMVGQIGTEQMSGVAIVNQLFFIFMLACFGICSGAGIFTAQFHGQGDDEGVRQTFRLKFLTSIIMSIVAILIFYFLADELIGLYLNDGSQSGDLEATLGYAKDYLYILLIGFIPYAITSVYASTLRETEVAFLPMIAGFIAVFFNCIGNYILIFGKLGAPVLGVKGAAISTVVSRFIELFIVIIITFIKREKYPFIKGLYKRLFSISKDLYKSFAKKGIPLFINEVLWSIGMSLLAQAYSVRGLAVVAGYNITSTIMNLFNIAYIALGNATGIIVGKYLGLGDNDKAVDYDRKMIAFSTFCGIMFGGLLCALSGLFPQAYNTTDEVKYLAKFFIIIVGCMMPFDAFVHACYFTLRSGGRTFITFLFDSMFVCSITVPLALILVHCTSLHIFYVMICVYSLNAFKCILGFFMIKKKIWLNKLV